MKQPENTQATSVIRTLTEFTPLGMAAALAAIARRSSRPRIVGEPDADTGMMRWCCGGAG
jgi:hypothetical protein